MLTRLLINYCRSMYGCELWNLKNPAIDKLCKVWRAGLWRNWNLPYNCHTALLQMLNDILPLYDLICKRSLSFASKCLTSESNLVRYVAFHGGMFSTLGLSTAAHVTPFLLMEIIVQQSIVYVRTGILKMIMLVQCLLWSLLCWSETYYTLVTSFSVCKALAQLLYLHPDRAETLSDAFVWHLSLSVVCLLCTLHRA